MIRFPFRYREKLRVHALRVMAVVEKTMHRLNSETKAAVVNSKMVLNFELVIVSNFSDLGQLWAQTQRFWSDTTHVGTDGKMFCGLYPRGIRGC